MVVNYGCELRPRGYRVHVHIQTALNLYSAHRREDLEGLCSGELEERI